MKKLTLLGIVQTVLSDTDGDEVNSIDDTIESLQVASIARDVYYNLMDEYNIPNNKALIQLEATATGLPVYLKLPDNVKRLEWLKYDCAIDSPVETLYNDIRYVDPETFMKNSQSLNSDEANVEWITDFSGLRFKVTNDEFPTYYTSFDEQHLVFNSYHIGYDTELQNSKTIGRAEVAFEFDVTSNEFIPDIPDHLFSLYLSEVKSNCFAIQKQETNPKIEQQALRLRYNLQRQKNRIEKPCRTAYGRR